MAPFSPILQMFGQSPVRPLQNHMEKSYACVAALLPFFEAVLAGDWNKAEILQKQIAVLEREADDLKKDFRLHAPKRLFLPVSRTDLLEMIAIQDLLPNKAKDIAGVVFGRHMRFPAEITAQFLVFLKRCLDAAHQALHVIEELDELLETSFRGSEAQLVEDMIIELDRIEHTTDEIQVEIRQALFKLESTLAPVDVMFLYKIIEWTGDLADHAHSVGGQLYLLLVR